ncbi:MAG: hypothetical protein ACOYJ2_06830 [Rickettsiales bacterium]
MAVDGKVESVKKIKRDNKTILEVAISGPQHNALAGALNAWLHTGFSLDLRHHRAASFKPDTELYQSDISGLAADYPSQVNDLIDKINAFDPLRASDSYQARR